MISQFVYLNLYKCHFASKHLEIPIVFEIQIKPIFDLLRSTLIFF